MNGKSNTTLFILGGAALLIVVLVVVANSSSKTASKGRAGPSLVGGPAWLAGGGTLAEGIGKGIGSILGSSSKSDDSGGYDLPAYSDPIALGGGGAGQDE